MTSMNRQEAQQWAGSSLIDRARLIWVRVPLSKPYHLSFGTLTSFDSVLCGLFLDGAWRWGETTPLPGYGPETVEDAWRWSVEAAGHVLGKSADRALLWALDQSTRRPFCAAALLGALESSHLAPEFKEPFSAPVLAAIPGKDPEEMSDHAQRLIAEGFTTLKLKVGRDPVRDAQAAASVLRVLTPGVRLRADANQAFDFDGALRVWDALDHPAVDHLEQPFPSGDWDSPARLLRERPGVRICLDESVWLPEDVERALQLGEGVSVKLKLMKQSSSWRALTMASRLQQEGRQVYFGNGVQGEIGSLAELAIYKKLGLREAAEINGFAKQDLTIIGDFPLSIENGKLSLSPWDQQPDFAAHLADVVVKRWDSETKGL